MINSYLEKAGDIGTQLLAYIKSGLNFQFQIDSPSNLLLITIITILILAFAVDRLLVNSFLGKSYRIFVAPGVILHELSHALLCTVTGAKIKKISLFDKNGGSVEHEPSKIPLLGSVLISLAPFVAGVFAILFLSHLLGIKEMNTNYFVEYQKVGDQLRHLLLNLNFSDYKNWLILYLALSVVVTMTPSKQDLLNMIVPIFFLVALIGAGIYYHFDFRLEFLPVNQLLMILSPIFLLLILAFIFSIIIFALSKLIKN